MSGADWIAVDWGTTNLRAWAMQGDTVLAEAGSTKGMGGLKREEFEPALIEVIGGWLGDTPMPVIACGMVGARQGWAEAAYQAVPCPPLGANMLKVASNDPRIDVTILPGVMQDRPADVMRGEETQIAGFLAGQAGWQGVLCLPGTHTKWVSIDGGAITGFVTCMTGDLFNAISTATVLRHSAGGDGWDDAAFDQGLSDGFAMPEKLITALFPLRAEGLLHGLGNDAARARLSGLLIGAELAATAHMWRGRRVALIGAERLSALYERGLVAQGTEVSRPEAAPLTLAGLSAARRLMMKEIA